MPRLRSSALPRRPAVWQRVAAGLALALVVGLNVFAVSPDLHAWLHAGHVEAGAHAGCSHGPAAGEAAPAGHLPSETSDEGCVVTQFAQGQLGFEAPVVLAAALVASCTSSHPDATARRAVADLFLPPGCGPPAV